MNARHFDDDLFHESFRRVLMGRSVAALPPNTTARAAAITRHAPVLDRVLRRHGPAKNVRILEGEAEMLAGMACFDLYQAVEAGRCDLAAIDRWMSRAEALSENDWAEPDDAVMKECTLSPLDYWGAQETYAHVLRGAGLTPGMRRTADGVATSDRSKVGRDAMTMLRGLRWILGWRAWVPYIRWPDVAVCQEAGRVWHGTTVYPLPGAVTTVVYPRLVVT